MVRKVILIDDNRAFADMLAKSLPWEQIGLKMCSVQYDGDLAMEAIQRDLPHLIITDIQLPGRDGLELVRQARQIVPRARFILITAYDDFRYAYQAIKLKAFDFLLKPFTREELWQIIRRAVESLESDELESQTEYSPLVQAAVDYVQARINQSVTLEIVAEELNISVSSLARSVKRETSMPYGELVTHLRIEEAKRLLRDPAQRVNEVADKVGYKNYTTLYKVFMRCEGAAPTDYRKGQNE